MPVAERPSPALSGPRERIQVLFDDAPADGLALAAPFAELYGDFALPDAHDDRPFTMINFVVSRDGRISFAEPGEVGGGAVNGGCAADVWLMALLRARCDAVLMGDGTLRAEPEHVWTPSYLSSAIGTCDAEAFEWLRAHEGRRPLALHVFVSLTGDVPADAAAMQRDDIDVVVATTSGGAAAARAAVGQRPGTEVLVLGDDRVDTAALGRWLYAERDVHSLLCEGGPGLYGSLLQDATVDNEFVTLSPTFIGPTATSGARRPSLVEGASFLPQAAPKALPISLRRADHHLLMRSRIVAADQHGGL